MIRHTMILEKSLDLARFSSPQSPRVTARAIFFLLSLLMLSSPLYAQDDSNLVASLIDRVGALEEETRTLRGEIEDARHELSELKKSFDTLNSDVDLRLKGSEGPVDSPLPPPHEETVGSSETEKKEDVRPTAEAEYERARSFLEKGDYAEAEKAFSAFLKTHAKHERAGSALYWLGVTHFVRDQHEKAASIFAKVYKNHPKSEKAPESLLKLAKSLGAQGRNTDACTALEQLSKEYPRKLKDEVSVERSKYNCK